MALHAETNYSTLRFRRHKRGYLMDNATKDLLYVFQSLSVSVSAGAAFFIYKRQKKDASIAGRQANRARVTEAYMRWHAEVLHSEKNTEAAARMLRRGYKVLAKGDTLSEQQAREFHMLYMLLNSLFLEWGFRISYDQPLEDFYLSVDAALEGLATNPAAEYRLIADNLWALCPGFPMEFRSEIDQRIRMMRAPAKAA
jgi:hypothetical protein